MSSFLNPFMFKCLITIFFLLKVLIVNAQTWTNDEIKLLQNLSIHSLQPVKDPSNKYTSNQKAIDFGKILFTDTRLSSNGKVSCSSCHIEKFAFTDNKKISKGVREGFRNTSSLLNSNQHHWLFADGAKDSLWSQALSSIESPDEHNFTRMEMMRLMAIDSNYKKLYQSIFKEDLPNQSELQFLPAKAGPNAKLEYLKKWKKLNKFQRNKTNIVFTNIGKAIAAYVATIRSKPTRFDEFIAELNEKKQSDKLNDSEQRGLRLFISQDSGCANCHSGPIFSNKTFHDIATGIPGKDNGRSEVIESVVRDEFNCLGKYSDAKPEQCLELNYINRNKHRFTGSYKTASLRSISKTAPYMHDGRYDTLKEVIEHYELMSQRKPNNTDLTPINLNSKQKTDLFNFLLTL